MASVSCDDVSAKRLWQAALLQVALDATSPKSRWDTAEDTEARRAAVAFIIKEVGVTAEDCLEVCLMAGIDPDEFRTRLLEKVHAKERVTLRRDTPQ